MIRREQTPARQMVMWGISLLLVSVVQGCQRHKAGETQAKVASREHHSVRQKLREVILGQEETVIWGHQVLVKPCRNAEKQTLNDNGPFDSHHIIRCGETKVEVVNEELRVNEKSYGKLAEKAPVQVVNGKVFISANEVQPSAQIAQK